MGTQDTLPQLVQVVVALAMVGALAWIAMDLHKQLEAPSLAEIQLGSIHEIALYVAAAFKAIIAIGAGVGGYIFSKALG